MGLVTTFKIRELSTKAAERAHNKWVEHYDWDPMWRIDDMRSHLEVTYEFTMGEPFYSLSYSQGDYASFNGWMYLDVFMKQHGFDVKYPALYIDVEQWRGRLHVDRGGRRSSADISFNYSTGNTFPAGVFKDLDEATWDALVEQQFDEAHDEMHDAAVDWVRGLEREFYDYLRDAYEWEMSMETFIEACDANEFVFNEEGEMQ